MAELKMKPAEALVHLMALAGRLAEAAIWAAHQKKEIVIQVPDELKLLKGEKPPPFCETCPSIGSGSGSLVDRRHAEILLAILRLVSGKAPGPKKSR